jgi:glycosyltransferase involved in cell wall biosynthesis
MIELGAHRDRICLICFGVDTLKFNPEHRDPQFKMAQFGSDSPAVISLRNLSPIYDVESLVKAVPLVLAHIPDAKFIIGGDGEQRNYLENLASSLGVLSSVKFVGQLPSDLLPRYLASVDVYVSTSLSDGGLASSTAEAMACGLPVVITDFGNNRDWIRDGENGFNVPLQDPPTLACKLVYLLQHDTFRRRFGEINRAVIEERNNYQKEMHRMEKLYIELIQKCRY